MQHVCLLPLTENIDQYDKNGAKQKEKKNKKKGNNIILIKNKIHPLKRLDIVKHNLLYE